MNNINYNNYDENIEFLLEIRQPGICKNLAAFHHGVSNGKTSWKLSKDRLECCVSEYDKDNAQLQYTYISTIEQNHNFLIRKFRPKPDFQGEIPTVIDICFHTKDMNTVLKTSTGKKDLIFIYKIYNPLSTKPTFNIYIDKSGIGVLKTCAMFIDIIPSEINQIPLINVSNLNPISIITTKILSEEINKLTNCSKLNLSCYEKGISFEGIISTLERKFFSASADLIIPNNSTENMQNIQNMQWGEFVSDEVMNYYDQFKMFQVSISKRNAKNFTKLYAISGDQPELKVFFIPDKILLQSHISNCGIFNIIIEYI